MTQRKLSKRMIRYLEVQRTCCKSSTIGGYQTNLAHFCDYLQSVYQTQPIHKKHIANLSRKNLQGYMAFLNQKNLAPYTRVNYLLSVKKYLVWEVDEGTLKEEVLEILDRKYLPKVPEYLPRPLSLENDHLLITQWRASKNSYDKLFLFLRLTGLRISELINLPHDCILTNSKDEKYLKVPLGKMNNERLIPLNEETLNLIDEIKNAYPIYPKNQDSERLIGIKGPVHKVYPLLKLRFHKSIGNINDQNKLVTFHRLRHTFATSLLTGGVGLASLMKLLGHRRIEMTLRYAKVTPQHLRTEYLKAIENMDQQWKLKPKLISSHDPEKQAPADLFHQLSAFLNKASSIDSRSKKNIRLRIARLEKAFRLIFNLQKFIPHKIQDKSTSRWAG